MSLFFERSDLKGGRVIQNDISDIYIYKPGTDLFDFVSFASCWPGGEAEDHCPA